MNKYLEGTKALFGLAKDKVVETASRATASLYIENPLRHKKEINFLDRLYMTHPEL